MTEGDAYARSTDGASRSRSLKTLSFKGGLTLEQVLNGEHDYRAEYIARKVVGMKLVDAGWSVEESAQLIRSSPLGWEPEDGDTPARQETEQRLRRVIQRGLDELPRESRLITPQDHALLLGAGELDALFTGRRRRSNRKVYEAMLRDFHLAGKQWQSQNAIAKAAGVSRGTVITSLDDLCESGLLLCVSRGRPYRYKRNGLKRTTELVGGRSGKYLPSLPGDPAVWLRKLDQLRGQPRDLYIGKPAPPYELDHSGTLTETSGVELPGITSVDEARIMQRGEEVLARLQAMARGEIRSTIEKLQDEEEWAALLSDANGGDEPYEWKYICPECGGKASYIDRRGIAVCAREHCDLCAEVIASGKRSRMRCDACRRCKVVWSSFRSWLRIHGRPAEDEWWLASWVAA